ncbi:HAD-IIA family hydrolase [Metabacillus sp. FJAT-53654]|uniref:HAD-IIA family hydrolase n=1 Tax=Metabacillus rhizosphaerae TaxID=3117747 RepID=A0ABZ2MT77_9BACI
MTFNLANCSTFIFDLDGSVYSGNRLYTGVQKLLQLLSFRRKKIFFLSNNSTDTAESIRKKLQGMGLSIHHASILVATELVGDYLLEKYGKVRVKTFGTTALEQSIKSCGHIISSASSKDPCDVVVVGRDPSFTYEKLYDCSRTLANGAKLVAVNPDLFHPGEDGSRVPETGAIISAIQAVSGYSDYESVGKPFDYSFKKIQEQSLSEPKSCIMIGDNPYTDILGGYMAGMHTAWISHGELFPSELGFKPDVTVSSIGELVPYILFGEFQEKSYEA